MGFAVPFGVIGFIAQQASRVFSSARGSSGNPQFLNPKVAAADIVISRSQEEFGNVTQADLRAARLVLRDEPRFIQDPAIADRAAKEAAADREQAATLAALALLDFPTAPPPTPSLPQFSEPVVTSDVPITRSVPVLVGPPDVTVETKEEPEVANNFELIPFLSGVANVFGAASELGSVIRGPVAAPAPASIAPIISSGVGAVAGTAVASFLGFGNGNGTALSRARDSNGRRVTRRQVITAARVCGLEVAAQSFGLSVTDICTIVSKGMPRRSRGISSADMRRTRSTLRKMATMRKTLKPLCR